MITLSLHLKFPKLWVNIQSIYDWLPNIGAIDFYSIFARVNIQIPHQYVEVGAGSFVCMRGALCLQQELRCRASISSVLSVRRCCVHSAVHHLLFHYGTAHNFLRLLPQGGSAEQGRVVCRASDRCRPIDYSSSHFGVACCRPWTLVCAAGSTTTSIGGPLFGVARASCSSSSWWEPCWGPCSSTTPSRWLVADAHHWMVTWRSHASLITHR